jgi:hypothetical protein
MYHTQMISLRLPAHLLAAMDAKRGGEARGHYIRRLIEQDLRPPPVGPQVPTGYYTTAEDSSN